MRSGSGADGRLPLSRLNSYPRHSLRLRLSPGSSALTSRRLWRLRARTLVRTFPENPECEGGEPRGWSWSAARMKSIPLAPRSRWNRRCWRRSSLIWVSSLTTRPRTMWRRNERPTRARGGSWLSLLAALAHLAAAEKVYHSLTYLGQKLGTSAPPPVPLKEEGKGSIFPDRQWLGFPVSVTRSRWLQLCLPGLLPRSFLPSASTTRPRACAA